MKSVSNPERRSLTSSHFQLGKEKEGNTCTRREKRRALTSWNGKRHAKTDAYLDFFALHHMNYRVALVSW